MDKVHVRIALALIIIVAVIVAGLMILAFIPAKPPAPQWSPAALGPAPTPNWSSPNVLPPSPWDY